MRRSTCTAVIAIAMLALAVPAAGARPAAESAKAGPGTHLTPGQLHRIDGSQPVALAPASPVEVAPVETAGPSGTDLTPWIFLAVPLALTLAAGGLRKAMHRTLIPHRRSHAAV
jgi:hypothetical protein